MRRGVLTIDLAALAANWRELARRAAPARAAAVIKANAYGIGIEAAAPALYRGGLPDVLRRPPRRGRARARRAGRGRAHLRAQRPAGAAPTRDGLRRSRPGARDRQRGGTCRWSAFNAGERSPRPFALHIDTGMNRLGFASLEALGEAIERHGAAGADLADEPFRLLGGARQSAQRRRRSRVSTRRARRCRTLPASLANSSGIFLPEAPTYDLVRPGYALYGGNPTPGATNPMRAVVDAGRRHPADALDRGGRDLRLQQPMDGAAPHPAGHAARRLRRRAAARAPARSTGARAPRSLIAGRLCKLVGRVSMDLTIADVTDLPEDAARPGELRADCSAPTRRSTNSPASRARSATTC